MEFPFLSIIVWSSILTAVIILLLPKERKENARMFALAATALGFLLAVYLYVDYNRNLPVPGTPWAETLRFVEEVPVGSQYRLELHRRRRRPEHYSGLIDRYRWSWRRIDFLEH